MFECAGKCRGISSLFMYGREDGGGCQNSTCSCGCLLDSEEGECTQGRDVDDRYNLYRVQPGELLFQVQ